MTLILRETQDLTSQHQELYDFLQEQIEHFPDRSIRRLFQNKLNVEVSTMAETTAEFLLARGIERGARETTIENILSVLTARFPSADVNTVKPVLEAIADLNRLKQLLLNASLANSFQAFQHELQ